MTRRRGRSIAARSLLAGLIGAAWTAIAASAPLPTPERLGVLIQALGSPDGAVRAAASREVLKLGNGALPELERAGARPMATAMSSRLDAVYSLIRGLPMQDVRPDSFGILAAPNATREDIEAMGKRQGFVLRSTFTPGTFPTCYVQVQPGRALADVLRNVLSEEPMVVSVSLNRVDR